MSLTPRADLTNKAPTGQTEKARELFEQANQRSTLSETQLHHAEFLAASGEKKTRDKCRGACFSAGLGGGFHTLARLSLSGAVSF